MLTPDQLQTIDRHLRKENWLLNEDLITELTDHYINGISERMAHGMAFDMALREIHRNFGGRPGLLKMEEEKNSSHFRIVGRELRQLIISYFQPPRLSLTLLLLGFSYWAATNGLVSEWLRWANVFLCLLATIPAVTLFMRNGYFYVKGKREAMQPFAVILYRYLLTVNIFNIINFLGASTAIKNIEDYSTIYQTLIVFGCLLIWTIIIDFVLVQPYRQKAFAN